MQLKLRNYADAETVLREVLAAREKAVPTEWIRFNTGSLLGASLAGQRRFAEAEQLMVGGYEGMRQRLDSIPIYKRESLTGAGERLADFYAAWDKPAQAAEWRQKISR
jgi:eukaryotic-like serine/threonine-protein kinase